MSKLPAPGTDPYNYKGHSGVDVKRGTSQLGKPFFASGPGTVLRLSSNAAGGNWIVIKYDAIPYAIGYAHMNSHAGCPKPGTRVREGSLLGYVGNKGTRVTGPHIHMEAMGNATPKAIYDYFDFTRTPGSGSSTRHITVKRTVKEVQKAVGVTQDGIWGPKTEAAVKDFQKAHGLKVDGIWGPASDKAAFSTRPSASNAVKDQQNKLRLIGYTLVVDGIKGPATNTAIKDFQRRNGLAVDGIWGPKTEAKYQNILATRRPVLRRGSRGNDVKVVQRKLKVAVDGIFGPRTETAVKSFQGKNGLKSDGIVGKQTWLKLGV